MLIAPSVGTGKVFEIVTEVVVMKVPTLVLTGLIPVAVVVDVNEEGLVAGTSSFISIDFSYQTKRRYSYSIFIRAPELIKQFKIPFVVSFDKLEFSIRLY